MNAAPAPRIGRRVGQPVGIAPGAIEKAIPQVHKSVGGVLSAIPSVNGAGFRDLVVDAVEPFSILIGRLACDQQHGRLAGRRCAPQGRRAERGFDGGQSAGPDAGVCCDRGAAGESGRKA